MKNQLFLITSLLCLSTFAIAAGCCNSGTHIPPDSNSVNTASSENNALDGILENISKASSTLKSCESKISYLVTQNLGALESKTLQTGKLFYLKENNRSKLRIRFEQIQQDDFDPEEYIEDYFFDGVWLTKINHKLEQVDRYQQAPEREPIDVFELISHHFPLVGFSGADSLRDDFDISLADDPNVPVQLLLDVKKDSKYQDKYAKINFWIDPNTFCPSRVKAYSTQGDIYDIRFLDQKINKKLKNAVFTIETPSHFRQNIRALETGPSKKGK